MSSSESDVDDFSDVEREKLAKAAANGDGSSAEGNGTGSDNENPEEANGTDETTSWEDLGLIDTICQACRALKWKAPSKIQREAIPLALEGKDIIGLAETGSGKTGAFAIPILQALLDNPQRYFAIVLTPTRELAFQISEQFEALGATIGIKCCVVVGGMDLVTQAIQLARKPHIIIATPGRLVDHLENTKGFNLKAIRYLVMDEADRILNMDFEVEVNKILKVIPRERRTFLFSATMTKKVKKLERACLRDPAKVEVSSKYQTVEKLLQYYIFIPAKYKDVYLVHILNELAGNSFMIFCSTCSNTVRTALVLRALGLAAVPLHGQMSQNKRLAALNKFKSQSRQILISTDVASRGLDIPHVDVVLNLDIPMHSKDYIHRVGRTARAGRAGQAITFVTQYDVELYQRIEHLLGKKLPLFKCEEDEVMALQERVAEAQRTGRMEQRDIEERKASKGPKGKKRGGDSDDDDTEQFNGVRKRLKPGQGKGKGKGRKPRK
ncbi:ATP-dependent RNA helicase DDX47 [Anopheles ziemanni]|uniref:ATP-dependent RNA helicase DDX47 n=1 Tax=Anopheles coustani TaxID=139045 RepID=UPI002657EC61|nr:ATP-dependent RNA helicase DDX47 [Anopheles coustani]XP_058169855.1 ATP-dependent RNA helicase DDX47 [Anopheles ziemanni]